jgi:protein-S-isoprenylcysteine O-methyltransferase Ste14
VTPSALGAPAVSITQGGIEASDSLVTSGQFARVRNPFYLGCFLASASVFIAVPSAVALAGVALHIAAAEIILRGVEEPILAQAHGAEFSSYKQRTGRFLPRLTIRTPGVSPPQPAPGHRS